MLDTHYTSGGKVGLAIKFNEDSNTKYYASDTTLEVGKIYHIVVTLDGSKIKIFINGQLDKSIDYNYTIKNSTVNMVRCKFRYINVNFNRTL